MSRACAGFAITTAIATMACSGQGALAIEGEAGRAGASARPDLAVSSPAGGDAGRSAVPQDAGSVGAIDASPGAPTVLPRVELDSLSSARQQQVFAAIDGFIRTAQIAVKVSSNQVVPWSSAGTLTPVSVVLAHHAIHHDGETFFTCHRWYLETMEKAIAPSLPNGRIPTWRPDRRIPDAFAKLAPPSGGDCETKGNLLRKDSSGVACEFAYTNTYTNVDGKGVTVEGLEETDPSISIPAKYLPGNVCSFASAGALAKDIGAGLAKSAGFHNDVHNTIGGTMQSMDAPAAAIFWPWHATVDEIFQSWLDCKVGKPPPACP